MPGSDRVKASLGIEPPASAGCPAAPSRAPEGSAPSGQGSALRDECVRNEAHESCVEVSVRIGMSVADGELLSDLLLRMPTDVTKCVMDQLWLRTVFVEQLRRTLVAERPTFEARADRILADLDPQEKP